MNKVKQVKLSSWGEIHDISRFLSSAFVYRGQASSNWELSSSLERSYEKFTPLIPIPENNEHWILNEFREKFHLHSSNAPKDDNHFEWLALLQHYGCPTRLLDFSESIYISSHFALSEAVSDSAIWAINLVKLRENVYKNFELTYDRNRSLKDTVNLHNINLANRYIANNSIDSDIPDFVIPLYSTKRSLRLTAQQGLFLAVLNLGQFQTDCRYMQNLAASFGLNYPIEFSDVEVGELINSEKDRLKNYIVKIVIPGDLHIEARGSLLRMNITDETLFLGLEGLAKSMLQKHIRG